ncbi:hypothetical protein FA95DRAFT_697876 [Auriscalpium vulgare]|uniref:Uncharacterized protein n=1 Tax=Auriscalpium vulgare TaxID=40419 RepID=A0ACB8S0I0_9AGAM|nr:hypothetical protein FA95DRAFT_697876 [Auriscalpium vulgare]
MHDVRPTRVHRDRDIAPQPTDIAERMVAAQRKKHRCVTHHPLPTLPHRSPSAARPKDRAERAGVAVAGAAASRSPPSPRKPTPSAAPPPPQVVVVEPSADEFSRRLTISGSPRATKLYNPETDVIPMRRTTEPEAMSDSAGSSHAVAKPKPQSSRQLFDHRRDDPHHRFFVPLLSLRPQTPRRVKDQRVLCTAQEAVPRHIGTRSEDLAGFGRGDAG